MFLFPNSTAQYMQLEYLEAEEELELERQKNNKLDDLSVNKNCPFKNLEKWKEKMKLEHGIDYDR